jgi:transcriptional antiterminator NusG
MGLLDDLEGPVEEPKKEVKEIKREDYGVRLFARGGVDRRIKPTGSVDFEINVRNIGLKEDIVEVSFRSRVESVEGDVQSEWIIEPLEQDDVVFGFKDGIYRADIPLNPGEGKSFIITVRARGDLKYGERCTILLTATSKRNPLKSDALTLTVAAVQAILAVKTQIGYERNVADEIEARAKRSNIGVLSILSPVSLRGYIFVEVMNPERLSELVRGIRRARGMVKGELNIEDIQHYLAPKISVSGMVEGDIVELIGGPFKGEKARIKQIDETKETVTVELFEATVPIPVTVKGEDVRVIQKEEKEE